MTNQVYANMMEVSCKAANGKSVAAMPDPCMTPPPPPGVPVPYPNTGLASDCTEGSTTVQISGQEVMLKNKSYFKRSTGDEAGCAPKKGVMTGQIQGKCYFNSWSMDVLIEGENVVRHLDLTTHNHASFVGNSPAWPYVDETAMKKGGACHEDVERYKKDCKDCKPEKKKGRDPCASLGSKPSSAKGVTAEESAKEANPMADSAAKDKCLSARRCLLQPWTRKTDEDGSKAMGCCKPQTAHHLIEKASFLHDKKLIGGFPPANPPANTKYLTYDPELAPCVCAEGTSHNRGGTHELMHVFQKASAEACGKGTLPIPGVSPDPEFPHVTTYGEAKQTAVDAFQEVFPTSECDSECLKKQLDAYHNKCGIDDNTKIKAVTEGIHPTLNEAEARKVIQARSELVKAARAERAARGTVELTEEVL
jgi:Toxin PAAR-like domain/GHH signature containing HNH/Endo VII superfamily nuclease toxin  2